MVVSGFTKLPLSLAPAGELAVKRKRKRDRGKGTGSSSCTNSARPAGRVESRRLKRCFAAVWIGRFSARANHAKGVLKCWSTPLPARQQVSECYNNIMPKVKSDSSAERRSEGSGWQGGQLFGSENTETTFTGGGFKDKEKAKETLRLLEGRDINYQYQVINSMYNRAKVILKRTKDAEKVKNLQEAVDTLNAWLEDYRTHSRSKENFGYLPLDTLHAFRPLAKEQGVLNGKGPTFLDVYEEAEGDHKKLRVKKVEGTETTWDIHRNKNLKPLVEKLNKDNLPLYTSKGQPSKEHLGLIVWGYSPEAAKVKKLAAACKKSDSGSSGGSGGSGGSEEDSS